MARKSIIAPRLSSPLYQQISDATQDFHFPNGLRKKLLPSGFPIYFAGQGDASVLYFGDSNVQQYWPRVEALLERQKNAGSVIFATRGGCPPIVGVHNLSIPNCIDFAEQGIALANSANVRAVVLSAAWYQHFNNPKNTLDDLPSLQLTPGSEASQTAFNRLAEMIGEFARAGKTVWLVLNIPTSPVLGPKASLVRSLDGQTQLRRQFLDRKIFDQSWSPTKDRLIAIARAAGAKIIDPMDVLCDNAGCPQQTPAGSLIYMDDRHLRASWVREHATFIDQTLENNPASNLGVQPGTSAAPR